MNQEFVRVLLVEGCETTARFLHDCCASLPSYDIDLARVETRAAALDALLCVPYDAYLLASQFVLGKDGDLLPAILELGRFAPSIALVDGPEAGRAALDLGVADWLEIERLQPWDLERSLRLTLALSRSERQLVGFNRARQVAEDTWQENEFAFQVNEERLHGILESLDNVVWSFNPQTHKLLYLNAAVDAVYGYTVSDFFTDLNLWRSLIHPDDRDRVEAYDRQANASTANSPSATTGFDIDYRILRRDGTLRWLRERTRVIYDERGRAVRRNSIASDITDHKQAEALLHQQMERERLLAQLARDIRSSLNLDEILNTTVREVRKLLGCDRVALVRVAAPPSGVISHEATAEGIASALGVRLPVREFLRASNSSPAPRARYALVATPCVETATLPPALQKTEVKSQLVVPILQQESLWGLLVVHQCLQKRDWQDWELQLLQQLATHVAIAVCQAQLLEDQTRSARELARSNQELEQFAYIASHDLQEPLRAVISFAQLLETEYRDTLPPEAREYIDFIVEGAMRMRQLIQDLLALSRVGTRGREFTPTDCQRALEQAIANLSVAIAESHAEISYDPLPTIIADESQLIQLFQNTIANAIKFRSEQPPRIEIRAVRESAASQSDATPAPGGVLRARPADGWRFSVRDNGIGIDAKYSDRIFEIFQRLHNREDYEGTGIGLAICQKIVQRHGGRIWVESIPGKGSIFYFTLGQESH